MAMYEIRWHGRGGQGVKTAALLIAEVAMGTGKFTQGFPEYGPERSGAPVTGFTRISDDEITVHCAIVNPNVVIVLDESLLSTDSVLDGFSEDSLLLVNTKKTPQELRKELGTEKGKFYTVNANQIAVEEIGRPIPNVPIIGSLANITGMFDMDELKKDIRKKFENKFSEKIVAGNLNALSRSYDAVQSE